MGERPKRIILIGPSGSGKSELAARLSAAIGYGQIDTDERVVARIRMPIAEFFSTFGEPAFRAIEAEELAKACREEAVVIATGGGVVLSPENWMHMRPESAIIGLTASPETLVARVAAQAKRVGANAERPLLVGDAVARMRDMLVARGVFYAAADATIDTDPLDASGVCERALAQLQRLVDRGQIPYTCLQTPAGRSDIFVSEGIAGHLGELMVRRWPNARRAWVISDEHVAAQWGQPTQESLRAAGFAVELLVVAPGENSKRMREVKRLADAMTAAGVTRRDAVVALGGGVVGDLAGFVASVVLRGLPLVQLPTSLLAMVDSSVGGKTGVNTQTGKNLIGAFYQPGLVLIDPAFLSTLPAAEFRSGMGEVIKHSLIQSSTPLGGRTLATLLAAIPLESPARSDLTEMLKLNVAIKRSVVQADERESGLRMILNFGHTAGHAIEADGYRYRHGEAIAIGMVVASRLARRLGRVDNAYVLDLEATLIRAGLPVRTSGSEENVIGRLSSDKKNVDGALNWILPGGDGRVERVTGVPLEIVREVLRDIGAT